MSIKAQATRGLKWQAIELVGRQLLSLLVFGTISRLLDPADFGLFALVGVYLAFVGMFASQGIRAALIQRQSLKPEHLDTAFWFSVVGASIICLGTIVLAEPVSKLLGEPKLVPLLRWSSLSLVITAASTIHNTLFVRDLDFRRPAIRLLLSNLIGGGVGVGLALTDFGVWALVWQQLAVSITSALFLWAASPYRPAFRFSWSCYHELRGVSSSIFATSLLWFMSSRLDQLILSHYAGVGVLGLYIVAAKLPELLKQVTHQPISQVAMPTLSRLQNDHGQMRKAIYQGMELNAVISFAIFVGLACIAGDVVPLVFGKQWTGSQTVCALLSLYTLVSVLQVFVHPALVATGAGKEYVLLNVWQVVGVLLACLIGVQYGAAYVALGLLINALIAIIPSQLLLRKWIGLDSAEWASKCLVPAGASALMAAVLWLLSRLLPSGLSGPLLLACKVPVGAVIYLGSIWLVKPALLKQTFGVFAGALKLPSKLAAKPRPA